MAVFVATVLQSGIQYLCILSPAVCEEGAGVGFHVSFRSGSGAPVFVRILQVIQFCQELQIVSDYPNNRFAKIYSRHARQADLVLDVDPFRAEKRKEICNLEKLPLVLRNTIPLSAVVPSAEKSLLELARVESFAGLPVVLYAGGIGAEKPFSRLVYAIAAMNTPVYFLAFCATTPSLFEEAQQYAAEKLKPGTFIIRPRVARDDILAVQSQADVGIVDYPYSLGTDLESKVLCTDQAL